jgi:carboxymethylenebutenolidase
MFGFMGSLTIPLVMGDADALLDFARRDPAASNRKAGAVGYCMSGQYAVNFAARHPERIGAAASIYGVKLVTDRTDSPHLILQKATAEFYFACAEHDEWSPIEMAPTLEQAAKAYAPATEVEIYPGVHHGFAFRERPVYDGVAAERHWERLFSLFRRRLQPAATAASAAATVIDA